MLSIEGREEQNNTVSLSQPAAKRGRCDTESKLFHWLATSYARKTNEVGDAFAGAARSTVGVEAAESPAAAAEVSAGAAVLAAALVSADAAELEAAGDSAAAVVLAGAVASPPAGASAAGGAAGEGGPPAASLGGAGVKAA